jgi:hypothetical protein
MVAIDISTLRAGFWSTGHVFMQMANVTPDHSTMLGSEQILDRIGAIAFHLTLFFNQGF